MTTTIDVDAPTVAAPRGRDAWWRWAVLGLAAAVVVVGGVFFTPASDRPVPRDSGSSQGDR